MARRWTVRIGAWRAIVLTGLAAVAVPARLTRGGEAAPVPPPLAPDDELARAAWKFLRWFEPDATERALLRRADPTELVAVLDRWPVGAPSRSVQRPLRSAPRGDESSCRRRLSGVWRPAHDEDPRGIQCLLHMWHDIALDERFVRSDTLRVHHRSRGSVVVSAESSTYIASFCRPSPRHFVDGIPASQVARKGIQVHRTGDRGRLVVAEVPLDP